MKNIYKLIEHLVENWQNNLSEALAPRVKQQLMGKFKQKINDYEIEITDKQLSDYIDFFDSRLKNNSDIKEKDLYKYVDNPLSFIQLVSSYKGSTEEEPEETEITPDVVYNEDGLIIYNGSNEANCLNFGRGEQWCITRGSFAKYRYDSDRKNPTFYLVKDTNLPNNDRKSFFVVVVGSDNTYKVSDRSNNDVGGRQTEWNRWEPWSFVEQNFPSIRGLQRIFKYIPISKSEKLNQEYKDKTITIGEWLKAPYSFKEQYLIIRKGQNLFSDIDISRFVTKILPKSPQIAEMISKNYGIINLDILLKEFDSFSNQNQKSIIANASRFTKVNPDIIESDVYPWSAKKAIVKGDLLQIPEDERYYITKDDNAIVKLKFNDDRIKIGVVTENETYPSIKLNTRTAKFLLDYPDLDKIPFNTMLNLAKDEIIPKKTINVIIEKAKEDPNSAIIIRDIEGGQILIDSNSLTSYKIEGDRITKIPFNSEEIQNAISQETDNTGFQESILNLLSQSNNIPNSIEKESFKNILKSIPYSNRMINGDVILVSDDDEEITSIIAVSTNSVADQTLQTDKSWGKNNNWREINTISKYIPPSIMPSFIAYLRATGQAYNTEQLVNTIKNSREWNRSGRTVKAFIANNPPVTADNIYTPAVYDGQYLLINRNSPRESLGISDNTGRLVKASIPVSLASRILRTIQPAEPATEPTVQPQEPTMEPVAQEPTTQEPEAPQAAPAAQGGQDTIDLITQAGLATGFDTLPTGVRNRILNGDVTQVATDRGATRRNRVLGTRGRVVGVITAGQSKFYVIRLASGTMIGSVAMQPDAQHYIVTTVNAFRIPNANALVSTLQQRNLTEEMKAPIIHMHALTRPQELEEIKYLLQTLKK